MSEQFEIHIVSDGKHTLEDFARKAAEIEPYVDYFHLREKDKTAKEIFHGICLLKDLGIPSSKIIVNDRVDAAVAMNVAGVQLAHHSLDVMTVKETFPKLKIGRSIHSIEEARSEEANGANYLLFGHIFASGSKPDLQPRGLEELEKVVNAVAIPVIAIGGISPQHMKDIISTGAKGVAIMSGVLAAPDPVEAIQAYINVP